MDKYKFDSPAEVDLYIIEKSYCRVLNRDSARDVKSCSAAAAG